MFVKIFYLFLKLKNRKKRYFNIDFYSNTYFVYLLFIESFLLFGFSKHSFLVNRKTLIHTMENDYFYDLQVVQHQHVNFYFLLLNLLIQHRVDVVKVIDHEESKNFMNRKLLKRLMFSWFLLLISFVRDYFLILLFLLLMFVFLPNKIRLSSYLTTIDIKITLS